jgi:hypothetical protein
MKAVRLFALLLILVGVVASAHSFYSIELLCGSSTDSTLCDQTTGEDLACTEFCGATCTNFTNVTASCNVRFGGGYVCKCHGDPLP